jgi:hypothetical protein
MRPLRPDDALLSLGFLCDAGFLAQKLLLCLTPVFRLAGRESRFFGFVTKRAIGVPNLGRSALCMIVENSWPASAFIATIQVS